MAPGTAEVAAAEVRGDFPGVIYRLVGTSPRMVNMVLLCCKVWVMPVVPPGYFVYGLVAFQTAKVFLALNSSCLPLFQFFTGR